MDLRVVEEPIIAFMFLIVPIPVAFLRALFEGAMGDSSFFYIYGQTIFPPHFVYFTALTALWSYRKMKNSRKEPQ